MKKILFGFCACAAVALITMAQSPAVISPSFSQVYATNGTAAAPSMSFASETNTGWYRAGAGNLAAAVGGTSIVSIGVGGVTLNSSGSAYQLTGKSFVIATAPTISSGFGASPSIVSSNGTATFRVNVGTGGAATSGVIGLPTATTGWNCTAVDITNNTVTRQTSDTTTTATVTAAAAWAASDVLLFQCAAF